MQIDLGRSASPNSVNQCKVLNRRKRKCGRKRMRIIAWTFTSSPARHSFKVKVKLKTADATLSVVFRSAMSMTFCTKFVPFFWSLYAGSNYSPGVVSCFLIQSYIPFEKEQLPRRRHLFTIRSRWWLASRITWFIGHETHFIRWLHSYISLSMFI